MNGSIQDAYDPRIISGDELRSELRRRRRPFLELTIPNPDEAAYLQDGWELVRRNKRTVRVRKRKPVDHQLEDDVWVLLALMGFGEISQGRDFKIPLGEGDADIPPKQIDVLAVDDETVLVVECKASTDLRRRSLQKDLNETRALQQPIRSWINQRYPERRRICFVYVTRNIRWSEADRGRARNHQIRTLRERQVEYYRKLVDIIGPAARHQLQADLLEGSPIQGLRTTVPALKGTFGSKTFYQFVIEPDRLLKLAFVSHRRRIDAEAVGTYQRLLKKKRLKDIAEHINATGGVFPTNIVVNFRPTRRLRFDSARPSGEDPSAVGILHLPNTYKCAWVIDGQHRLYGFALSEWASKGKVPVLAFEGLDPSEEINLFVDINNKQVRVPRSLLVQLEPELSLGQDEPEQQLRSLHAQLAIDLSDDDDSPLFGRVASEWDTDTSNKSVTLPQLVAAIRGSQLVGSIRGHVRHPGHLYDRDDSTTLNRAKSIIQKFLSLFSEGVQEHWERPSGSSGGFLCTNFGISGLLLVFKSILDLKAHSNPQIEFHRLSPDAIVGLTEEYIAPAIKWFNEEYDQNRARFHGRYGSGGPIRYSLELMQPHVQVNSDDQLGDL